MSYFGEELIRQMTARDINAVQMAERVQLSSSQIYNWVRGIQTSVSIDQLNLLAAALTDDPSEHARLLLAHLLDEKTGALGDELVEVRITDGIEVKDRPRPRSKRERAMEILSSESVRDRDLAELLVSLAGYVSADLSVPGEISSTRKAEIGAEALDVAKGALKKKKDASRTT